MLRLSQTTGYAIKALGCLSEAPAACLQTADIAERAGIPRAYLVKILRPLVDAGMVHAKRGIGGGISLVLPPEQISLLQVVVAMEGPDWLGDCLLGLDECNDLASCPTHDFWVRMRRDITAELRKTSLASIISFRALSRRATSRVRRARPVAGGAPRASGGKAVGKSKGFSAGGTPRP